MTLRKTIPDLHTVLMLERTNILEIIRGKRTGLAAGCVRISLSCLTPIYRAAVGWRNRKFDRALAREDRTVIKQATLPVVSVGNLTTGGTGKTPMVIWIAKYLRGKGLRVVLISRGYGAGNSQTATGPNDEALEMEHRLPDVPHLQDPDRYRMSTIAVEELESEVIVLDDAFQHRQFHRDLDLVLIDATDPFGGGRLLPRGLLREPIANLHRADAVIVTRTHLVSQNELAATIDRIRCDLGDKPIAETTTRTTSLLPYNGSPVPLETIDQQAVYYFCGIGNPENFRRTVDSLGHPIVGSTHFDDHHDYDRDDLDKVANAARSAGATAILCTHKDLVKVALNRLQGIPVYAVLIEIEFQTGRSEIERLIDRASRQETSDKDGS